MGVFLSLILLSFNCLANSPLNPVKTDSPRDTMKTFMTAMQDYKQGVENDNPNLKRRINDAVRCFASAPQGLTSGAERLNAAIFLKETIDRVIEIEYQLIPEKPDDNRWRLKDTEIVLRKVTEGDREGEWLITYDTWSRAKDFYKKVEDLPYLPKSGGGASYEPPWVEQLFPEWAHEEVIGLKKWQWLGILIAIILGFLLKFLIELGIRGFRYVSSYISSQWQNRVVASIEKPLGLFAATAFWYFSLLFLKIEGLAFNLLNAAIQVSLGVAIIWLCYKLISVGAEFFAQLAERTESPLDDQLVPFAERTLKVTVAVLGILMVMQNMGINVFSLLAGLGLGGLAFALAAKDTAANLFGSIMILVDRPFKIGDWVLVEGVEGTVEEIGFRSTRVRTFYDSLITLPNSVMATAKIDNMGERQYRRTIEKLGVTYDTPPEKLQSFIEGIKEILLTNKLVRKDYFNVAFSGYKDFYLEVLVHFFLITDSYQEELYCKQDIFFEIYRLADKLGVEFAFPTQTLHLQHNNEQKGLDSAE